MTTDAEIHVRVIDGAAAGPRLLVIVPVHGDECEPMEAVRRLATRLPALSFRGSVALVPVANPTAFAAATRTGGDGLDMARSFPGRADGSPTQRAAHAVTEMIRAADAMVDLHTGGRVMRVVPMTGYTLHPDPRILAVQRRMAAAFGLPVIWGTTPTLEGRSLSAARDLGVPAIYAEHGGGCDEAGVAAYEEGCLNVMREVGMIAPTATAHGIPAAAVAPLVVEDDQSGSGHMQASHPAPAAGFFRPQVALGQPIRRGDVVGTVCDPLNAAVHEVLARATGFVLVLRAEPSVQPGDALVVILEHGDEAAGQTGAGGEARGGDP